MGLKVFYELILAFGMFTIALIKLIVDLLKKDKEK